MLADSSNAVQAPTNISQAPVSHGSNDTSMPSQANISHMTAPPMSPLVPPLRPPIMSTLVPPPSMGMRPPNPLAAMAMTMPPMPLPGMMNPGLHPPFAAGNNMHSGVGPDNGPIGSPNLMYVLKTYAVMILVCYFSVTMHLLTYIMIWLMHSGYGLLTDVILPLFFSLQTFLTAKQLNPHADVP